MFALAIMACFYLRFVDVSENAFCWYFVAVAWLPIYFVIYWGARAP